jgi:hypothetical protein
MEKIATVAQHEVITESGITIKGSDEEILKVLKAMANGKKMEINFWQGIEEDDSIEKGLQDIFQKLKEIGVDTSLPEQFINELLSLSEQIYGLRYHDEELEPLYHHLSHSQWTVVHTLRAYTGAILSGRDFDLDEFKLAAAAASLHEVEDWWSINVTSKKETALKSLLKEFLDKHDISQIDVSRVILLDDYNLDLEKAVKTYLRTENPRKKKESVEPYLSKEGESLYVEDPGKVAQLRFLGRLLRFGDYCQCLDRAYLHPITLISEGDTFEVFAGPLLLAFEVARIRHKVLKSNRWVGLDGSLLYDRIGPDRGFRNVVYTNFSACINFIASFYDNIDNPYIHQLDEYHTKSLPDSVRKETNILHENVAKQSETGNK